MTRLHGTEEGEEIRRIVEHASHLLPAQGPIRLFIHHNTLHAFEELPFEEAVVRAGERFGCRPFLEEEEYRRELSGGRIRVEDLTALLRDELGERAPHPVAAGSTRLDVRLTMLRGGLHEPEEDELDWFLAECEEPSPRLWEACVRHVAPLGGRAPPASAPTRHRDLLLAATGEDSDALVHPLLIRLCAAFLDQGIAPWPMPGRERGLFRAFVGMYRGLPLPDAWLRGLNRRLAPLHDERADRSVASSLGRLGVPREEWPDYIEKTLLALRGWPGMIHQTEERPDRVTIPSPPGSLLDYVAVRLILEEQALAHVARRSLGHPGPLGAIREAARGRLPPSPAQTSRMRAYALYQVARRMGWDAGAILASPARDLMDEIESFPSLERRRILHLAYERRHRHRTLDALTEHRAPSAPVAAFQAVFCIDEREESLRRHLEETEPSCETFGTAGFFGVAMYYQGVEDAHPFPLCPIAIRPERHVREEPLKGEAAGMHRLVGRAAYAVHVTSRTGVGGSILAGILGTLASLPLVLRVFLPRQAAALRSRAHALVWRHTGTRLRWDFSVDETAGIVRALLEETGLIGRLSRLVVVVGHGSSSLNNPHESAHDCGACGGGRGGPNARAFAAMANDPRVRERLNLPPDTVFVGASHNSCNDGMEYFDLDLLPPTHIVDLGRARAALDQALRWNAHERCRRFDHAPLDLTPQEARRHVEARTEDLAQVRPEYGHATNAVAVIGRRTLTRGLFMDRRAFLVSYDPAADPDGAVLARILRAVGPVCAGINLEYYFSFVDSAGYGCATKLPHNISSLLGVMDGHASDLRTGLPWQMVEIHEPVRLVTVIEASPERVRSALAQSPPLLRLALNRWIQVAALDPGSGEISVLRHGTFVRHTPEEGPLPAVRSSADWYRGHREHLGYARIGT
ncbi:MAG: DUF2309 domain-containing protein [Planctomycetes bacterium]|nr:DUF2309 domain-containing protein [Planctomycetota bacterium]